MSCDLTSEMAVFSWWYCCFMSEMCDKANLDFMAFNVMLCDQHRSEDIMMPRSFFCLLEETGNPLMRY